MSSPLRDYPIKIKLLPEELALLDELCTQHALSSSEMLREVLEYAMRHTEKLETYIQTRKLSDGQTLFKYWDLPKERRNHLLLEALVGDGNELRCKLMIIRDALVARIVPSPECYAVFHNQTLQIRYSFRKNGKYWSNEILLNADSILSVLTYDERTNQTSAKVPLRFESLAQNEYLQINVR